MKPKDKAMPEARARTMPPVAIVGVSALLPGSSDPGGFWRTAVAGEDQVTDVPATHWLVEDHYDPDPAAPDKTYAHRGAFLSPVPFDPLAHGIPPKVIEATDTSQLLALVAAEQLLSGLTGLSGVDRERVSVILGTSSLELLTTMGSRIQRPVWLKALRESGIDEDQAQAICDRIAANYVPWQEASLPGLLSNVVAGRIANRFDLHGSNYTTDAACASSLAALSSGANELATGQADLVITGGVDTLNDPVMYTCFSKTPALSPTGDCRPFSDQADGMVLGEGIVLFAIRRLEDAERDGDRIHAVIRGIGTASDGRGSSIYAPVPEGQARALRRAYDAAGYGPETVELVEAHGTGTAAGDAAEFAGLRAVFGEAGRSDAQWCALGSVKSQIGHTKNAAGAAGLLKATLALSQKVLPPTIKVDRPNPALGFADSPFYLNTQARPWISDGSQPRRAAVSSFGFGGTDFHITLEEYRPSPGSESREPELTRVASSELVLFSADSPQALVSACRASSGVSRPLATIARETQGTFDHTAQSKLAIVATTDADLTAKLAEAADRIEANPETALSGSRGVYYAPRRIDPGKLGLLFSGQGSQYVGMGAELAMLHPAARSAWDSAAGICFDGVALHRVVFPPPVFTDDERAQQDRRLTRTEWAQPALAVQSLALLEVLRTLGVSPDAVAGHSFGELVALHVAGCYDAETLIRLARKRGELMRDAATAQGAMLAVAGSIDDVRSIVAELDDQLWVANHNAPKQVVVSGTSEAIDRLVNWLAEAGRAARKLNTAAAFHSPLMDTARAPLRESLEAVELQPPRIDAYSNAEADRYPPDPDAIRDRLADHLQRPVRFVDQIENMHANGVRTFVEVGAGATLTRLTNDILAGREHLSVSLDHARTDGVTALHEGLAQLAVRGIPLNFEALWCPFTPIEEPRMDEKPGMTVDLLGANYGKPYPPPGGAHELPRPNPPQQAESTRPFPEPVDGPVVHGHRPPPDWMPGEGQGHPSPSNLVRGGSHLVSDPWLDALRETQRQASEAHATYQRVMAETHLAFLRMSEAALGGLSSGGVPQAASGGLSPASVPEAAAVQPAVAPWDHAGYALPQVSSAPPEPVGVQVPASDSVTPSYDAYRDSVENPAAQPDSSGVDVALLLEVVAEKTGYPLSVLDAGMELESDLGIDSIKRVEILSAVRERVRNLAEVDPALLGAAGTLGEVAELLGAGDSGVVKVEAEPAAPQEVTSSYNQTELTRQAISTRRAPAVGFALPGLIGASIAITEDGTGVAEPLAAELVEHGVRAFVTADVPADTDGVIFLGGLRSGSAEQAIAVNREALRVARAMVAGRSETPRVFVAVQDTGGDFGLSGCAPERVWVGGVAALARTAAKEWPGTAVKAIDCERGGRSGAELARAIALELLTGGAVTDVGLTADGARTVLHHAEAPFGDSWTDVIGPDSVIVISGGARGVTAMAARALAAARKPKVVLLGRTALEEEPSYLSGVSGEAAVREAVAGHLRTSGESAAPQRIRSEAARVLSCREIRATLDALESCGSPARYLPVDVRDSAALSKALAGVRAEWGPITGLVHGAGVLADKTIKDKTDEQLDYVFGTKVDGLRTLLDVTAEDPLDLLCVFSSVAACYGNAGQSDYAMANEVITQIAAAERAKRPGCLVRTIAWGPWDGGMVDASLADRLRASGVQLIPIEAGAKAFVDEVLGAREPVQVVVAAGTFPKAEPSAAGEIVVTDRSHPYLADHSVAGTTVVPVAMVLEWFTAAAHLSGTCETAALRDLDVLRKITLDHFAGDGDVVRITCAPGGSLVLHGTGELPHYRAQLGFRETAVSIETTETAVDAPRRWDVPAGLDAFGDRPIYDGYLLFHGPAFQALRGVDGVSAAGAVGTVVGARALGWPDEHRHTDPAAVDGGIQLATLWAERALGTAALPMGVGEFRLHRPGMLDGAGTSIIRAGEVHSAHAECDLQLCAADGTPVAELHRLRLVARPDGAPSGR
ncbi:type I polyketide synthase [Saccharopolyspora elongata]|nr:type I polyketide synthase [Saccharopolyspora elongata]